MKNILFQGDSITDCGRDRNYPSGLGKGYPLLVSASLGYENPNGYAFFNRGVSGNRIVDIYARMKRDILNLKPDVMSILIGVNDVWHELDFQNGVDAEKYFKFYCMLIEEIKAELPNIKIMIMEPYVIEGSATSQNWKYFSTEVAKRAQKSKEAAEKYGLTFIPLQSKFDELKTNAPDGHWSVDGVHPTSFGHEIIKREWIKAFSTL